MSKVKNNELAFYLINKIKVDNIDIEPIIKYKSKERNLVNFKFKSNFSIKRLNLVL